MKWRIPSWILMISLALLLILTTFRWELIWNATLSTAYAGVLAFSDANGIGHGQLDQLLEFWWAALFWWLSVLLLAASLFRRLLRKRARKVPSVDAGSPGMIAVCFLILMAFVSLTSPFLTPVSPNSQGDLATLRLVPPLAQGVLLDREQPQVLVDRATVRESYDALAGWLVSRRVSFSGVQGSSGPEDGKSEQRFLFVFGTDDAGRDVFSRVIAGSRVTLGIGLAASLLSVLIGSIVGFTAGLGGRGVDGVLMRLTDLALAIPGLFLAIGLMAFLGQSLTTLIVVLACTGWMGMARVIRGEVLVLREREFILAARLLGVSGWRIVVRHMLSNMAPVLVSVAVLQFANAALAEAALGFLGLGVQPPTATWGNMMGEGLGVLQSGWWVGLFPGAFLASVLVAAHDLAEGGGPRATKNGDRRSGHDQLPIQDHP
jgi:ABC-type dipeptide/oligopeptide/nickel transport system permease subunit